MLVMISIKTCRRGEDWQWLDTNEETWQDINCIRHQTPVSKHLIVKIYRTISILRMQIDANKCTWFLYKLVIFVDEILGNWDFIIYVKSWGETDSPSWNIAKERSGRQNHVLRWIALEDEICYKYLIILLIINLSFIDGCGWDYLLYTCESS